MRKGCVGEKGMEVMDEGGGYVEVDGVECGEGCYVRKGMMEEIVIKVWKIDGGGMKDENKDGLGRVGEGIVEKI